MILIWLSFLVVVAISKCDQTKSGKFHPLEAYNATMYSALAYSDDPVGCANKIFKDEDLEIVEAIGRKCNQLHKYKESFAVIAISHSKQKIILAFRGTTSEMQLLDEISGVATQPKVPAKVGGYIQQYFSNATDQLYPCVQSGLKDLVDMFPTYRVIVAGHSLGRAIASIATAQLVFDSDIDKEKTTLYTFGMPRPGDQQYAEIHDKLVTKSWRVVHYKDMVANLPFMTSLPDSPYHHQREIFYGEDMHVLSNYTECFNYEDKHCGHSVWSFSINNHLVYYGIDVGLLCDHKLGKRNKRSDEESDMSHHFIEKECKRISASDMKRKRMTKLQKV